MHEHDDDEGYRGPATLTVDDVAYEVTVTLLGHVEPLDGRFRWYGRVSAHDELHAALEGRKRPAHVATPQGSADGELSDVDPWGRYRLAGESTPPFSVALHDDRTSGMAVAGGSGRAGGPTP